MFGLSFDIGYYTNVQTAYVTLAWIVNFGQTKRGWRLTSSPLSKNSIRLELKQCRLFRLSLGCPFLFSLPSLGSVSLKPYLGALLIEPVLETL